MIKKDRSVLCTAAVQEQLVKGSLAETQKVAFAREQSEEVARWAKNGF